MLNKSLLLSRTNFVPNWYLSFKNIKSKDNYVHNALIMDSKRNIYFFGTDITDYKKQYVVSINSSGIIRWATSLTDLDDTLETTAGFTNIMLNKDETLLILTGDKNYRSSNSGDGSIGLVILYTGNGNIKINKSWSDSPASYFMRSLGNSVYQYDSDKELVLISTQQWSIANQSTSPCVFTYNITTDSIYSNKTYQSADNTTINFFQGLGTNVDAVLQNGRFIYGTIGNNLSSKLVSGVTAGVVQCQKYNGRYYALFNRNQLVCFNDTSIFWFKKISTINMFRLLIVDNLIYLLSHSNRNIIILNLNGEIINVLHCSVAPRDITINKNRVVVMSSSEPISIVIGSITNLQDYFSYEENESYTLIDESSSLSTNTTLSATNKAVTTQTAYTVAIITDFSIL